VLLFGAGGGGGQLLILAKISKKMPFCAFAFEGRKMCLYDRKISLKKIKKGYINEEFNADFKYADADSEKK
jgi:hypothetical protein